MVGRNKYYELNGTALPGAKLIKSPLSKETELSIIQFYFIQDYILTSQLLIQLVCFRAGFSFSPLIGSKYVYNISFTVYELKD